MLTIYESTPVGLKCPYCGIKNIKRSAGLNNGANLIICDPAEGGCDRCFFAKVSAKVVVDEIQPIGPSQPETCQSCIHWEEMKETPFMDAGGRCNYYTNAIHGAAQIHTVSNHSCTKWEPE